MTGPDQSDRCLRATVATVYAPAACADAKAATDKSPQISHRQHAVLLAQVYITSIIER
jgi:hypothetical protein